MWVPQSPTLHMMSCTDHAFLWCPSCFSPSAHTEPHSTNCPVSTTCTTQSSLKSSLFKCGLFGNFGTLPFGCIVFHTVVHCSLHFDQVPRKCVLDTEHTWAQCPACLQPVQVDPAKTARTGPSAQAHLWTVHCNTRLQRAVLIQWN